jgi:hypothetical protein
MLSVSCRTFPETFLSSDMTSLPSEKPYHPYFPSIQTFKTAHYPKQPASKNQEAKAMERSLSEPSQTFESESKKKGLADIAGKASQND